MSENLVRKKNTIVFICYRLLFQHYLNAMHILNGDLREYIQFSARKLSERKKNFRLYNRRIEFKRETETEKTVMFFHKLYTQMRLRRDYEKKKMVKKIFSNKKIRSILKLFQYLL